MGWVGEEPNGKGKNIKENDGKKVGKGGTRGNEWEEVRTGKKMEEKDRKKEGKGRRWKKRMLRKWKREEQGWKKVGKGRT